MPFALIQGRGLATPGSRRSTRIRADQFEGPDDLRGTPNGIQEEPGEAFAYPSAFSFGADKP